MGMSNCSVDDHVESSIEDIYMSLKRLPHAERIRTETWHGGISDKDKCARISDGELAKQQTVDQREDSRYLHRFRELETELRMLPTIGVALRDRTANRRSFVGRLDSKASSPSSWELKRVQILAHCNSNR